MAMMEAGELGCLNTALLQVAAEDVAGCSLSLGVFSEQSGAFSSSSVIILEKASPPRESGS